MNCIYFNKYNKCKNKIIFSKNFKYCINHMCLAYNKYAIYIQKVYIGYKVRQKIKNIFIKLPRDLQINIIYKIHNNDINHYKIVYYKKYFYNIISIYNIYKLISNNIIDIKYNNDILYIYKKIIYNINYFDSSFLKYIYIITNNILLQLNNEHTILNNYYNENIRHFLYILKIYCKKYFYIEFNNISFI